jgi:hypothetical protein
MQYLIIIIIVIRTTATTTTKQCFEEKVLARAQIATAGDPLPY